MMFTIKWRSFTKFKSQTDFEGKKLEKKESTIFFCHLTHLIFNFSNTLSSVFTLSPSPSLDLQFFGCSSCHTYRHPDMFVGRTRSYRTCSHCRHRQTPPTIAPLLENMIVLSELPLGGEFLYEGTATYFEADVFMDEHLLDLGYDEIVTEILETVELKTGYQHYRQRIGDTALSSSIVFFAKYIQRSDVRQTLDPATCRRHVVSLPTYNCKGEIKGHIRKDQNWIHLQITHHVNHAPQQTRRVFLTDEEPEFITSRAATMSNPQLYYAAIPQFGDHINRAQVYYWRMHAVKGLYRRHDVDISLNLLWKNGMIAGLNSFCGWIMSGIWLLGLKHLSLTCACNPQDPCQHK
ncbi:hypothetical protein BC941DRAFT_194272 [Chlamydoabsidia padenii]|nr:hypothetical protein BC941DRAFT_194272 [Chlamydoabsidia padenii]